MENVTRMSKKSYHHLIAIELPIDNSEDLTTDAIEVLCLLPKEPLGFPVSDIAQDIFGKTDNITKSRIKKALYQLRDLLYLEFSNTRPSGLKTRYGIKAGKWAEAQKLAREGLILRTIP